MAHEGQRQIITNARYAGGPAPGKPGWVDEDKAAALVARGSARYADRLSERVRPTFDELEELFLAEAEKPTATERVKAKATKETKSDG